MTTAEFSAMGVLGLVSSLHCTQMCGPIVLAYSGAAKGHAMGMHVAYNLGRILTYSALGAIAGWGGKGLFWIGQVADMIPGAVMVAGLLMIVVGVLMIAPVPRKGLVAIGSSPLFGGIGRFSAKFLLSPSVLSKFAMGLTLGFLPCGLVYAALAKSFSTGSALDGALTMAAFGAGTAAALSAIGSFAAPALGWLKRHSAGAWPNRIAALSMAVFGVLMVWRALAAPETLFAEGGRGVHCH